ncbi:MAG: hypothetical protein QM775_31155 [Pirellulales bacterium]
MSETKKTESKATVVFSGEQCTLCEKTGDTVFLSHKNFKAVVCPEHELALLKKWKKQREAGVATTSGTPQRTP